MNIRRPLSSLAHAEIAWFAEMAPHLDFSLALQRLTEAPRDAAAEAGVPEVPNAGRDPGIGRSDQLQVWRSK